MPSYYTLRMQFGLHQDPAAITRWLLDLVGPARVDEIMLFHYAEELNNGHDTHEEVQRWLDHSRPFRQALTRAGVKISLNPWHTILHCDRGRKLKPGQNWQTMVDPAGRAAAAVVCPLDRAWRTYIDDVMGLYAAEGFRVIWLDDDIRLHNHAPLHWGGCFCPLHVEEFNRRTGAHATREEIVQKCTAPGQPHPWREAWMDTWEQTHLAMIDRWRQIVEAGGSRLGLMSSGPEAHAAEGRRWENWWKTLSGGKPPIHRPHFWGYSDVGSGNLAHSIALLDQNRSVQPEGTETGPEIENFIYGPWNKSFRQTAAQMALAHILGSTNLNISLYDFMGNDPADEPERVDFLASWRPTLDWLADEFPMTVRPIGVGIPWSADMGRRMHTTAGGDWLNLLCPSRGWAAWLGAAGHAFTMRADESVNALSGPVLWSFSDDELRGWLSHGALLDGTAADILLQRGMGELIGLRAGRFVTHDDMVYSVENCLDERFSLHKDAQMTVNVGPVSTRLFVGELAGARAVSDIRSPRQEILAPGVTVFENALGGRVAIVPWDAQGWPLMCVRRAAQLTKLLGWLDPNGTHGSIEGGAWLIPQFLCDATRWRGVAWNASPDAVSRVTIHLPGSVGPLRWAEHVTADGRRHKTRISGSDIHLAEDLHQWEFLVIG